MRIAFMGTPDFAVPALDALVEAGHNIAAVYCQPPRPAGRGKASRPSPVQLRAEALGLEVRYPVSLRDQDEQAAFAALDLDGAVVAAYGLILPVPVLEAPRLGCFNIHASLLPRWRGAAPIQRAILAGDETTGVTIMQMEKGLDTGPMLAKVETRLADFYTGHSLTALLAKLGADLICEVLKNLSAFPPVAQPEEGITYAHKIDKSEAKLDFNQDAIQVKRAIHAFSPFPGAWFEFEGQRIKILTANLCLRDYYPYENAVPGTIVGPRFEIKCKSGFIKPEQIQKAGSRAMRLLEYMQGNLMPSVGTVVG